MIETVTTKQTFSTKDIIKKKKKNTKKKKFYLTNTYYHLNIK